MCAEAESKDMDVGLMWAKQQQHNENKSPSHEALWANRWSPLSLTFHELVRSGHVKLAGSEEAQQQRVRFVPKALLHQFVHVVSFCCPLLHHGPQVLQRQRPSLIRLIQLILRLQNPHKTFSFLETLLRFQRQNENHASSVPVAIQR